MVWMASVASEETQLGEDGQGASRPLKTPRSAGRFPLHEKTDIVHHSSITEPRRIQLLARVKYVSRSGEAPWRS